MCGGGPHDEAIHRRQEKIEALRAEVDRLREKVANQRQQILGLEAPHIDRKRAAEEMEKKMWEARTEVKLLKKAIALMEEEHAAFTKLALPYMPAPRVNISVTADDDGTITIHHDLADEEGEP